MDQQIMEAYHLMILDWVGEHPVVRRVTTKKTTMMVHRTCPGRLLNKIIFDENCCMHKTIYMLGNGRSVSCIANLHLKKCTQQMISSEVAI
mmetsp:Transcript_13730/g.29503  ORF Transcript_13730/g.29503 Transcript_13730/m.29503 type:complete len:91 (+) Transcript_13730:1464-1736(+)